MTTTVSYKSFFQAFSSGAALGLTAALVYGMGFVLYGIARTSMWIFANPANSLLPTLLANAVSVLIGGMFFAVLFGIFAAPFQAITCALVFALSKRLNHSGDSRFGAGIGLLVAVVLFSGLLLLFQGSPKIMIQVFWNQSFFFWFGLPGTMYIGMNTWLGSRMECDMASQAKASGNKKALVALPR